MMDSNVRYATIACSVITVLEAIILIANFDAITASIAITVANILTSVFPFVIFMIVLGVILYNMTWRARRRWW